MKIFKIKYLLIISFFTFFRIEVLPQTQNENVEEALNQMSNGTISLNDGIYNSFIDIDSLNTYTEGFVFSDKYNTLEHSVLFTARKEPDTNFVGIYKEGRILWFSEPIVGVYWGSFISIDDINNDGMIDLVTQWVSNKYNHIWIFSWSGSNCKILNEQEEGFSNITVLNGSVEIGDIDGDGIKEIIGSEIDYLNDPDKEIKKIFKWNGTNYILSETSLYLNSNGFSIANKIICDLNAKVIKNLDTLSYSYNLYNHLESDQQIKYLYFEMLQKPINSITPIDWQFRPFIPPLISFVADDGYEIKKNTKLGGFKIFCDKLPGIGKFYLQADHLKPISNGINNLLNMYKSDAETNSFSGYTIIPFFSFEDTDINQLLDSLIIYNQLSLQIAWEKTQQTCEKYNDYLVNAKTALQQNNISLARINLQNILHDVDIDSSGAITSEAYALLRYNTEYLLSKLPLPPNGLAVKLINSTGTKLIGGSLQYYEGAWKDAVSNNDGTFTVPTTLKTVSLRMNYAYGSQTKSNVTVGADTVVFQTVNATVQLKNSLGEFIDQGTVQYYSGAWRDFGVTTNGVATKELLPNNYSFRMSYAFASNDKQQNIGADPTVIFQTVNITVQLKNSLGNLIDAGTVQYYSGAWRDFGTTTNGVVTKELLPNNYSFRMGYAFASNDKQQNVGTDPTVIFQTVNAAVQLKNSLGNFIDQGAVQYYSGAWRDFGVTTNGIASKELLPNNYSFRMSYAFASNDKQQNVGTDPTVIFQTVNANVQLKNSLGNLIDVGTVQYYSGAWRDLGVTTNGIVTKELLPSNYSFRMSYAFASNDKQQNIGVDPTVIFQTVNAAVQLKNSLGNLIDQGAVQYYSGAWINFGTTSNGVASLELLPNNYSFRITHAFISNDKAQNIGTNNIVEFRTVLCNVNVTDAQNLPVNNAIVSYYSGAWRNLGTALNGTVTKELLPANLTFRAASGTKQADKTQNILTNNIVDIKLP